MIDELKERNRRREDDFGKKEEERKREGYRWKKRRYKEMKMVNIGKAWLVG